MPSEDNVRETITAERGHRSSLNHRPALRPRGLPKRDFKFGSQTKGSTITGINNAELGSSPEQSKTGRIINPV